MKIGPSHKSIKKFRRSQKGATAMEFALVAPAFLLLVFGFIEMALVMTKIVLAENSIRIAARDAIVSSTNEATIQADINEHSLGLFDFESGQDCVCIRAYQTVADLRARGPAACGACGGGTANVTDPDAIVYYEFFFTHEFITPLDGLINFISQAADGEPFDRLNFETSITVKNEPF